MRDVAAAICLLLSSPILFAATPAVAHAVALDNCSGTSYSWTDKDNTNSWTDPGNWDPGGVPGDCAQDSASIQPNPNDAFPTMVVPANTTLQSLSLSTPGNQGWVTLSDGSLKITGSFSWSGYGTISTPVTAGGSASVTISDNDNKLILSPDGTTQVNFSLAGVTTVSGTGLALSGSGANIINTGTFNLAPGAMITSQDCCVSLATFVNKGTVAVAGSPLGGGKATLEGMAFNNGATGKVTIGTGAVLELQVAPSTLAAGVSVGGGGTLLADNNANITLGGAVSLADGTTFALGLDQYNAGGTLSGAGTLRGDGTFSWTGGTLAADLTVARPVKTSITGGQRKFLDATFGPRTGSLTVGGDTTLSGTGLIMNGAAHLINTGTFNPQAGSAISAFGCCVNPAEFVNKGTLTVNVGAGNAFALPAPGWPGLAFINSATVDLKSGTFQFGAPGYIQSGGKTTLGGGSLESTSPSSAAVSLQGGTLAGAGTITAAVVNKKATIDPGTAPDSDGIITVKGNYTQASTGTLRIDIKGGAPAGDNFDQLAVQGTASLDGTLAYNLVNDFHPAGTDFFPLVTYTAHTGRFKALDPDTGSPRYWVNYKPAAAMFSYGPWGIDTKGDCTAANPPAGCAPKITAADYQQVSEKLGTPDFWGRYIGDSLTSMKKDECVPAPSSTRYSKKDITQAEVTEARTLDLPILPVYFNYDADVVNDENGEQCGKNLATAAIEFAQHFHIPGGTAIFVDIEYNVDTSKEFVKGWYDRFNSSFSYQSPYDKDATVSYDAGFYKAGYYADTSTPSFSTAYCGAVAQESAIGTNSFIWTSSRGLSWSKKADEPKWRAVAPASCHSQTVAWQYNGGTPPNQPPPVNVDTDEALLPDLPLWRP